MYFHSAATGDSAMSLVKCADALPLEQYFAVINAHFQVHLRCEFTIFLADFLVGDRMLVIAVLNIP